MRTQYSRSDFAIVDQHPGELQSPSGALIFKKMNHNDTTNTTEILRGARCVVVVSCLTPGTLQTAWISTDSIRKPGNM